MTPKLSDIHIFRRGVHTSMQGATIEYSDDVLADAAASYDPGLHEAPIVVGHPEHDTPAYGWVSALSYADGQLSAHPSQVDPDFAEIVRKGHFKKVSASFYLPDSPANPKPGHLYLRHIGFLGAAAPGVKGLKQVEFAADDEGVSTVEFGESSDERLWRRFLGWVGQHLDRETQAAFAELSGAAWSGDASNYEDAAAYCAACLVDTNEAGKPKVEAKCHLPVREPGGAVNRHALMAAQGALVGARGGVKLPDDVKRAAAKKLAGLMKTAGITPASSLTRLADFSETPDEDQIVTEKTQEQREADFAERETELAKREKAIADAEAASRNKANADFVEGLVKGGKLLPRDQAGMVAFMAALPDEGTVEFAEGDETIKKPSLGWLKDFLGNLPQAVDYSERSAAEAGDTRVASFAAPAGTAVDSGRAELYAKARAYQAKNPKADWLDAVRAVGG